MFGPVHPLLTSAFLQPSICDLIFVKEDKGQREYANRLLKIVREMQPMLKPQCLPTNLPLTTNKFAKLVEVLQKEQASGPLRGIVFVKQVTY